jgi:hypothetical protein
MRDVRDCEIQMRVLCNQARERKRRKKEKERGKEKKK